MSDRGLYILAGIAEGMEKGVDNYTKLKEKQAENKLEQEKWGLDKKIKDAQLKKLEYDVSPEEYQRKKEEHDADMKTSKALFELRDVQTKSAENKIIKESLELEKTKTIYQAAELNTLQSEGKTEGEARAIMAMEQGRSANIAGQQATVASPEFTEQYSDLGSAETNVATGEREAYGTRGSTRDPFLDALSRKAQSDTGLSKEKAKKQIFDEEKGTSKQTDEEFLKTLGVGEGDNTEETNLRAQAIQSLEDADYPTTEKNIAAAIKQMKG